MIEPGWIYSDIVKKVQWPELHPAYNKPYLKTVRQRKEGLDVQFKDTRRSVEVFYRLAFVQDPPLHFVVGRDAIAAVKKKSGELIEMAGRYESWSEGLEAS